MSSRSWEAFCCTQADCGPWDRRARRLSVFDSLGNVLATTPHHDKVLNSRSWEPIVNSAGDLFEEDWGSPPWATRIFRVEIQNLGVSVVDTLALAEVSAPTRTVESRGPGGSRGIQMVTAPSNARPRWSADWQGNLWYGNSSEFKLHKASPAGDTALTVELRRPPIPLERRQLDSLSEATGFPWLTFRDTGTYWVPYMSPETGGSGSSIRCGSVGRVCESRPDGTSSHPRDTIWGRW